MAAKYPAASAAEYRSAGAGAVFRRLVAFNRWQQGGTSLSRQAQQQPPERARRSAATQPPPAPHPHAPRPLRPQAPDSAIISDVGGVQRVYYTVLSQMLEPLVAKVCFCFFWVALPWNHVRLRVGAVGCLAAAPSTWPPEATAVRGAARLRRPPRRAAHASIKRATHTHPSGDGALRGRGGA